MWQEIQEFLNNHEIVKMIIDGVFLLWITLFVLRFLLKNRKGLSVLIGCVIFALLYLITQNLDFPISTTLFEFLLPIFLIGAIVVLAPDIRKELEATKIEVKSETLISSSQVTKISVADAVMFLASRKIGALITIEKHNSLDQYAERAIQLNADVSKELLINIFSPLTPLHDGAVIIRGNKIRCAGAYYVLTQHDDLDKTTGSRHRAGLGISEVTDSLTIIVSEETGNISIATEGFMLKITDRQKLLEYIDMFLK